MGKTFVISFDDGSVYDPQLAALLNRLGLKGTFNLNSGLEEFVWYFREDFPVRRQRLADTVEVYRGHEVASHSLHHHRLDSLPAPQLRREAEEDCAALKKIFGLEEVGFGVPFTVCGEREINILRRHVAYIRLSEFAADFALPRDEYHIPIHALYNDPDVREKVKAFAQAELEEGLFVLAGHSYELEALGQWDYLEELLKYIQGFGFENLTTLEFVRRHYKK